MNITPRKVPYFKLDVGAAFKLLTPQQRLYAHHLNMASWHGTGVCAQQLCVESLPLLKGFYELFTQVPDLPELRKKAQITDEDEFAKFVEYFALLYSNMGNYLSFGDSKFIPACSRDTFEKVVSVVPTAATQLRPLIDVVYDLTDNQLTLAYPPKGISAYYSADITEDEVKLVERFLVQERMMQCNTRVFKTDDNAFDLMVASANVRAESPKDFEGASITVQYGDFSEYMARVRDSLKSAIPQAANADQVEMLEHYVKHFDGGNIDDHKKSQVAWVRDKGPSVETNIGFIESYRDPAGVRCEWEGFVAVVNKDQSRKYGNLVSSAKEVISRLPWGEAFEKDTFTEPDFTSLEVLGFASSGVPLGICIPNYDDIRQDVGFKNVYLGNVAGAVNFNDKLNHLTDADWEFYKTHFLVAMSINVGVHELLGHGTGKLLQENEDGSKNFDPALINPLTGKPVATWYKPGESWNGKFAAISLPYEECRAEAVSLYLGLEDQVAAIFDMNTQEDKDRSVHVLWLHMVRAGMAGLEFYTPETKQWRQAHMRARYCILQTLLRQENPIVKIEHNGDDLSIEIDSSRIRTDGKKAIGDLLRHLNIYKATADAEAGSAYFEDLTAVDAKFVAIRETIMKLRKPRKQFVQSHTRLTEDGKNVELLEFEASVEGVLQSFLARHKDIPL